MSSIFMPHGMCYLWRTDILLLHALSDGAIAAAYFSIPLAILYFVRRRTDLAYKWVLPLFAAFIVACGTTHLLGIWVIWNPDYWIQGIAKAVTAIVSVATAILLWPLLPKLLALPSPLQLQAANASLESEVANRVEAQKELEKLNAELERRVAERTQQLERSNEELEKFAHHASHDLKAPLRAVQQLSQWIGQDLGDTLSADTSENLDLMQSRIRRMERLLDDLLEYSRVGLHTDSQYEKETDAASLIEDVLLLVAPPEEFEIVAAPGLADIRCKVMPLKQILLNLVSNAIKHHDRRDGRIEIGAYDAGAMHAITVSDDGPGIGAEFHDDIFEMFRTLKSKDDVESSGIGLAIVRKALQGYGGRIEVESSPGHGASFTIFWPKRAEL